MALPGGYLRRCFRACSLKQCLQRTGEGRAAEIGSGCFLAKCSQLLQLCWGWAGGGGRISEPFGPQGLSLPLISKPGELANIHFQVSLISESDLLRICIFFKSPALGNTDANQGFLISSLTGFRGPVEQCFQPGCIKVPVLRLYPRLTKSESRG